MRIKLNLEDDDLRDEQQEQPEQLQQLVWFSHLEKEFQVVDLDFKKIFQWREDQPPKMWDWDNCTVTMAKIVGRGKVRIAIRSKTNRNSDYMGHIPVQLRFMLGIDIKSISEPYSEQYQLAPSTRTNLPRSAKDKPHKRWVFKLDDRYWIWQWAKGTVDIKSTQLYMIHQNIHNYLEAANQQPSLSPTPPPFNSKHSNVKRIRNNVFIVPIDEKLNDFVPIIYQPAVDSLKNFVREVHCAKIINADSSIDLEVSLLFNNEELRRHRLLDRVYEKIRLIIYGRTIDVETFRIHFTKVNGNKLPTDKSIGNTIIDDDEESNKSNRRKDDDYFIFEGIYSGQHDIEYDTVHLDRPPAPKRPVEYYFLDYYHPIIFINTANHAMSEHDNNHDIWKWEYIPWVSKAPIVLGVKPRKDIDLQFTPLMKRIIQGLMKLR
jgi:hypothetical protein